MTGEKYIISIDQSTQGTKAILLDSQGKIVAKTSKEHEQIVNDKGWVSHNPSEIYVNTLFVVGELIKAFKGEPEEILGVGITNQRETSLAWDRQTGKAIGNAIVWQCSRASEICERPELKKVQERINESTGMPLSPYFPASKIAWILEHEPTALEKAKTNQICHGTIDSWLIYKLTHGQSYKTDYSNASRTQLFNINTLKWDKEICQYFGIEVENLPEICDSNSCFGYTDFEGLLPHKIPIHGVMGDSHGALFGQGCLKPGMVKSTYGTGSSIMMNIGNNPTLSAQGLVTSLAWSIDGRVDYVLEGNLNYTGAVIRWLKDDLQLIQSPLETEELAREADQLDALYLVPAFSGLGAPYWDSNASAMLTGMTRTTKKAELVRAALDCIAYQITDIIKVMKEETGLDIKELRVDGGATKNTYLMEFQSDIAKIKVQVSDVEELSGLGVGFVVGMSMGLWDEEIFNQVKRRAYLPKMSEERRQEKYSGWKGAVKKTLA